MQKIHGLFDRVVLDGSTLKCFDDDPWYTLGKLLKPQDSSELITEVHTGIVNYSGPGRKVLDRSRGHVVIPQKEFNAAEMNGTRVTLVREYEKQTHQKVKEHLKNRFKEIELHEDQPYPYTDRDRYEINDYIILKGPM